MSFINFFWANIVLWNTAYFKFCYVSVLDHNQKTGFGRWVIKYAIRFLLCTSSQLFDMAHRVNYPFSVHFCAYTKFLKLPKFLTLFWVFDLLQNRSNQWCVSDKVSKLLAILLINQKYVHCCLQKHLRIKINVFNEFW